MTFAASATFIELALYVPAEIIVLYSASTNSLVTSFDPDVILTIDCIVFFISWIDSFWTIS